MDRAKLVSVTARDGNGSQEAALAVATMISPVLLKSLLFGKALRAAPFIETPRQWGPRKARP